MCYRYINHLTNVNPIPQNQSATLRSSGPVSFGFSSLDPNKSLGSPGDFGETGPASVTQSHGSSSLKNELQEAGVGPDQAVSHVDRSQLTDSVEHVERATDTSKNNLVVIRLRFLQPADISGIPSSRPLPSREERTGNTLYQELQFQEPDALADVDETADITGGCQEDTPVRWTVVPASVAPLMLSASC
ncbi:hypothetical protein FHG87_019697 [Trinorchestia longiramus]|nr:hypothetical protein FHG87_019697 [Trinorchestia longiramus]